MRLKTPLQYSTSPAKCKAEFSQFTNTGAPAVTVHSWLGRQQPCLNGNTLVVSVQVAGDPDFGIGFSREKPSPMTSRTSERITKAFGSISCTRSFRYVISRFDMML